MNLQYISDSSGQTTGVFIPISEWNELKKKYEGIEDEEIKIPEWQILEAQKRLEAYYSNPTEAIDLDTALDNLEKEF